MAIKNDAQSGIAYLDMQAYVGITKHIGGRAATDQLLAWCHMENAREVLVVGCGIGVSTAYIAKKYDCHVVGVDISDKMIEWSRKRAKREHVESNTEFRTADIQALPFEANRFDAVVVESVVAFVQDKARAIRECVRVTKPGGYVGVNESFLTEALSTELAEKLGGALGGIEMPMLETWQSLWDASGLQDRVFQTYAIDARNEVRDRIQWIGVRWSLEGFARLFRLYLTRPEARASVAVQYGSTANLIAKMEYALFVGRKGA
ncbi:MAG: class I SAM-dependent methyltransferase [Chloroflexi bacterium]|nr:class I SAM-dependent methyltransferase [Chloroflexota bacterium]